MVGILLLALALLAGFLLWRRMQRGADTGTAALPAPLRGAAKRQALRPVDGAGVIDTIGSDALCIAGLACAYARMADDGAPRAIARPLVKHLRLDAPTADDLELLAPWIVAQGGGPTPAFEALTRRLKRLDHGGGFDKLMAVLGDLRATGMPSARQADALGALARIFRTA